MKWGHATLCISVEYLAKDSRIQYKLTVTHESLSLTISIEY